MLRQPRMRSPDCGYSRWQRRGSPVAGHRLQSPAPLAGPLFRFPDSGAREPMSDTDNWLTRTGANELAYRVRAFWQDRGAVVEVRVEPVAGELGCAQIFGLRSDL